jgi:transcriptional regulator with XRE-family HTH domain
VDVRQLLGKRIRDLREAKNMSQKDLSYTADLDRSYIAGIENGQRNVSIVNIHKISQALECSLQEFFNSDDWR